MTKSKKAKPKKFRSRLSEAIHETAAGLHRAGLLDKETMRGFDASGLTAVAELSPREIIALRKARRNQPRRVRWPAASDFRRFERRGREQLVDREAACGHALLEGKAGEQLQPVPVAINAIAPIIPAHEPLQPFMLGDAPGLGRSKLPDLPERAHA